MIATDPGTITTIQGFGFSFRKLGSFQVFCSVSSSSRSLPAYAYDQSLRGLERVSATAGDSACTTLSPLVLFPTIGDMSSGTCCPGASVVFSLLSMHDEPAGVTSGGGIDLTLLDCLPPGDMAARVFLVFAHTLLR